MGLGGFVGGLLGFGVAAAINVLFGLHGPLGFGVGFVLTFLGIAFFDID